MAYSWTRWLFSDSASRKAKYYIAKIIDDCFSIEDEKGNKVGLNSIIDILYEDLKTLALSSKLSIGQQYKITDHVRIHKVSARCVPMEYVSYEYEPLIVTAISKITISHIAVSTLYPDDIIHYTLENAVLEGELTGGIYYRCWPLQHIEANCDFRHSSVRYWANSAEEALLEEFYNHQQTEFGYRDYPLFDPALLADGTIRQVYLGSSDTFGADVYPPFGQRRTLPFVFRGPVNQFRSEHAQSENYFGGYTSNVVIGHCSYVTLHNGSYLEKITIGENATVVFKDTGVNYSCIEVGNGARINFENGVSNVKVMPGYWDDVAWHSQSDCIIGQQTLRIQAARVRLETKEGGSRFDAETDMVRLYSPSYKDEFDVIQAEINPARSQEVLVVYPDPVTDAPVIDFKGTEVINCSSLPSYHGFVYPTDLLVEPFNDATLEFTLVWDGGWDKVYINGNMMHITTDRTVTIPNVLGQHFITMDGTGTLLSSMTPFDILDTTVIPVATVHWDGTTGIIGDERHDYRRNLLEHRNQHDSWGCQFVSGFTPTPTFNNANTFSFAGGIIRDEELYHYVQNSDTCQIGYRVAGAATMTFESVSTGFAKLNAGTPQYDNAGTLTDLGSGKYGIYWIYGTNRPYGRVVSLMGQGEYSNIAAAQSAVQPALAGMSVAEWKLLYRVIIRNTGGSLIVSQADVMYNLSLGPPVNAGAFSTLPASNILVNASSFTGNLSTTDTTAQKVADKVDALAIGGGAIDWVTPIAINTTQYLESGRHHIISDMASPATYDVFLPYGANVADGDLVSVEIAADMTMLLRLTDDDYNGIDGLSTRFMWAKETCILRFNESTLTWTKIAGKSIPMMCGMCETDKGSGTGTYIGYASYTTIVLDDVILDNTGMMADTANSRIMILRPGIYSLDGVIVYWSTSAAGSRFMIAIHAYDSTPTYLNGLQNEESSYAVASYPSPMGHMILDVPLDSHILMKGWQNASGGEYTQGPTTQLFVQEVITW